MIGRLVMRGLDPRIHQNMSQSSKMDCRIKPGNDESMRDARLTQFYFFRYGPSSLTAASANEWSTTASIVTSPRIRPCSR